MKVDKRKLYGTFIGVIIYAVVIVAFTYARYVWQSGETNLSFNISDEYFYCESGKTDTVSNLVPTLDYRTNSSIETFQVNNIGQGATTFSVSLNITSMDSSLKSESLKYKLMVDKSGGSNICTDNSVTGCESVVEGNFKNFKVGMNTLAETIELPSNVRYQFYLFIYIDGNMENDTSMQQSSMSFTLDVCEVVAFFDYNGGTGSLEFLKVADTYTGLPTPTHNDTVISYNSDGGTTISNQTIQYTFDSWYLDESYESKYKVEEGAKLETVAETAGIEGGITTNHTLHAKWNPQENSGTSNDGCITLPTPTKTGYTFSGWYSDSTKNTKVGDAGSSYCINPENNSHTLYAKWTPISYTIAYNYNGGTKGSKAPTTGTYDTSIEISNPTKTGYSFGGWTTSTSAGLGTNAKIGTTNNPSTTWTGSATTNTWFKNLRDTSGTVTLTASWNTIITATFYYYNGASATASCTLEGNNTSCNATIPNTAKTTTPSGYTLRGWSTSDTANATTTANANATTVTISSNTSYYASYEKDVTVTFRYSTLTTSSYTYSDHEGATTTKTAKKYMNYEGNIKDSQVTVPTSVTGSNGGAAAENYIGVSKDINSATILDEEEITTENTTYYAVYIEYVVFYYYDGSSNTTKTLTRRLLYNATTKYTTSLNEAEPTPSAYDNATFSHWSYNNSNASNDYKREVLSTGVNSLYAVYKKTLTLSYNANEGSNPPTSQTGTKYYISKSGSVNTINPSLTISTTTPTRNGYTFKNWNTTASGNGTTYEEGASITISNNTTLYAIWQINRVAITLNANNCGTITSTTPFYVENNNATMYKESTGTTTTTPALTSRTGYTFLGWYTASTGGNKVLTASGTLTGTAVTGYTNTNSWTTTEAKTLYAQCSVNSYTVTVTAGNGISKLTASGWTGTETATITKNYSYGDVVDLTTITSTHKTGYNGTVCTKTSGSGTLRNNCNLTVGEGATNITINAASLETPEVHMTGSSITKIYGSSDTTLRALNTTSYDSGVTVYFRFGYSLSHTGTATYGSYKTDASLNLSSTEFLGTRYYKVQAYATDGTLTSTTATYENLSVTLHSAKITLDTNNCGTLSGTNSFYVLNDGDSKYKIDSINIELPSKKVIIIGDINGVTATAIQNTIEDNFDIIYTANDNFNTSSGTLSTEIQTQVNSLVNQYGSDQIMVILGVTDEEGASIQAETFISGDPSYSGVLANVALNLEVYHIFELSDSPDINTNVYRTQIEPKELETGAEVTNIKYTMQTNRVIDNISFTPNEGYGFVGWYTATSGGDQVLDTNGDLIGGAIAGYTQTTISGDTRINSWFLEVNKTLYAQCENLNYTVTYYNGTDLLGTSNHVQDTSSNLTSWSDLGGTISIEYDNLGWRFAGWSTSPSNTTITYTDGQSLTTTSGGNINLYAVYKRYLNFHISLYDTERKEQYWNPVGTSTTQLTSVITPILAIIPDWTTLGYSILDGINPTYTKEYDAGTSIRSSPNELNILHGLYKRTLTINYDANGGTGTTSSTTKDIYLPVGYFISYTTSSQEVTLPSNSFTRDGYTFKGWEAPDGTIYAAGDTYNPNLAYNASSFEITMKAVWVEDIFKVKDSLDNNDNVKGIYDNLKDAIDAADATTYKYIVQLKDYTDTSTSSITINKNITLSTNSYDITINKPLIVSAGTTFKKRGNGVLSSKERAFTVYGNLYIQYGTIKTINNYNTIYNAGTGNVIIEGGTVTNSTTDCTSYAVKNVSSGRILVRTATISGGAMDGTETVGKVTGYGGVINYGYTNQKVSGGTTLLSSISISGGKIQPTGAGAAIKNHEDSNFSKIYIANGSVITSPTRAINNSSYSVVAVNDADITCNADVTCIINDAQGKIAILGGSITSKGTAIYNSNIGFVKLGDSSGDYSLNVKVTGSSKNAIYCGNSSSGANAQCFIFAGTTINTAGRAVINYNGDVRMYTGSSIECTSEDYSCLYNKGTTYSTTYSAIVPSNSDFIGFGENVERGDSNDSCHGRIFIKQGRIQSSHSAIYSNVENNNGVVIGAVSNPLYNWSNWTETDSSTWSKVTTGPIIRASDSENGRGTYIKPSGYTYILNNGMVGGVKSPSYSTPKTNRSGVSVNSKTGSKYTYFLLNE